MAVATIKRVVLERLSENSNFLLDQGSFLKITGGIYLMYHTRSLLAGEKGNLGQSPRQCIID